MIRRSEPKGRRLLLFNFMISARILKSYFKAAFRLKRDKAQLSVLFALRAMSRESKSCCYYPSTLDFIHSLAFTKASIQGETSSFLSLG